MNAADHESLIMLYRYHLKARYHKSSKKSRHFSYADYFTYPVCPGSAYDPKGSDNQGSTE